MVTELSLFSAADVPSTGRRAPDGAGRTGSSPWFPNRKAPPPP
jgi:hypothetical protein